MCYTVQRTPMDESNQLQRDDGQTGASSRHVSLRVPLALYERLEQLAEDSNETVSHCARRLLTDGLGAPGGDAIDGAISALLLVRHRLAGHGDHGAHVGHIAPAPVSSRIVNILNAKTDLQHLIDEVERGGEIIITHAGAQRARLVPVAARDGAEPTRTVDPRTSRPEMSRQRKS